MSSLYRLIFLSLALLLVLGACASSRATQSEQCQVRQIAEVLSNPVEHAGEMFCGHAYAAVYGRSARILEDADDVPPSSDLAMVVTTRTRSLLGRLSTTPQEYYIEARVDPMLACFVPSGSGEDCVPYCRPITMHLLAARKLQ